MSVASTQPETFSAKLWAATAADHSNAEHSPFMTALLGGELPREGYVDLLAQHHRLYEALESVGSLLANDPISSAFLDPNLHQLDALTSDLLHLAGPDWADRYPASSATDDYTARVREVATSWPAGYVAHHYTRYLGDLSGGVIIARVAAQAYGLTPGRGGSFSRFERIADAKAYKVAYRAKLDAAPWSDEEQLLVIDEIRHAYDLNQAVFSALNHHTE